MGNHLSNPDEISSQGITLCIEFVNTVEWHTSAHPKDSLNSYEDLVKWSKKKGILNEAEAARLLDRAERNPDEVAKVLKRAVELREAVYRILLSIDGNAEPAAKDLNHLNDHLSRAMANSLIVKTRDGFAWDVGGSRDSLDWILNPIIRSAAELLISDEIKRLKRCADPECGWLFFDNSKNRSRKWCDMKDCGNRAKARRYYERKKMTREKMSRSPLNRSSQ